MHPEIISICLFWFVTAFTPGPNNIVASYSGFNLYVPTLHSLNAIMRFDQDRKVYSMAPEMMQSISIRNEEEYERWKKSGIPANRTVAFTGTRRSPKSLYDLLHKEGIACIFGTLGNIDKQAERQGDKVYRELRDLGVDIFATDRPLECAEALGI